MRAAAELDRDRLVLTQRADGLIFQKADRLVRPCHFNPRAGAFVHILAGKETGRWR
jgi:hypothetical protein